MINKLALVTGAYKGLGLEFCRQLGKDGYTVILTARNLGKAVSASEQLKAEGLNIIPKSIDVADEEQIIALVKDIESQYSQLDLIVNNAGINSKDDPDPVVVAKSACLSELDPKEIIRHVSINSVSPILVAKHFRRLLEASEHPIIVSISSWLGSIGIKETNLANYSYSASKAALNMLNRSLSIDLKEHGIISVVVNPGWVQTDMGGDQASLTPAQSVRGLIDNVIHKIKLNDTGKFFQWDGTEHPW